MKTGFFLLAITWGFLLVQPFFLSFNFHALSPSCMKIEKKKSGCSKSRGSGCQKQQPQKEKEEKNECEKDRCNPIMSCPAGNFFLDNFTSYSIPGFPVLKQKKLIANDNRLSKALAECWHPPEII
jgi:hypothetical protein